MLQKMATCEHDDDGDCPPEVGFRVEIQQQHQAKAQGSLTPGDKNKTNTKHSTQTNETNTYLQ